MCEYILMICFAFMIHELGHYVAIAILGFTVKNLELCYTGVRIRWCATGSSSLQQILVSAAGPAANFLVFLIAGMSMHGMFAAINLVLVAVNLLPFAPSDGSKILTLLKV